MSLHVKIKKKLKEFMLDIEFEASPGCLGILGASGCGKSVTLKSIAGIITPDEGTIILDGNYLYDSKTKVNLRPQKRRVGYLFQNYALFPNMTVRENIGVGLVSSKLSAENKNNRINQLIRQFHLEGLEKRYPINLSGGQQQRVALARIIAYEPSVILLDEPFSAMDSYLREELQIELSKLLKSFEGIAIMVTHDRDEVYKLSNELMVIDYGSIIAKGETKGLFENPVKHQVAKLTGCKNFSKAAKTGEYEVKALDWGVTLKTGKKVPDNLSGVGIRAHDFYPITIDDKKKIGQSVNRIKVNPVNVVEAPFEYNIIFSSGELTHSYESSKIYWKREKKIGEHNNTEFLPQYLGVDENDILLIE